MVGGLLAAYADQRRASVPPRTLCSEQAGLGLERPIFFCILSTAHFATLTSTARPEPHPLAGAFFACGQEIQDYLRELAWQSALSFTKLEGARFSRSKAQWSQRGRVRPGCIRSYRWSFRRSTVSKTCSALFASHTKPLSRPPRRASHYHWVACRRTEHAVVWRTQPLVIARAILSRRFRELRANTPVPIRSAKYVAKLPRRAKDVRKD